MAKPGDPERTRTAASPGDHPVDDGGYAFPVPMVYDDVTVDTVNERGMSLRDYFAAMAVIKVLADVRNAARVAQYAYDIADAMIQERKKAEGRS